MKARALLAPMYVVFLSGFVSHGFHFFSSKTVFIFLQMLFFGMRKNGKGCDL
jgi:hypothetical protein